MDDVTAAEVKRLDEKVDILVENLKIAGNKFEDTVVARFAQVNEFRGSLDDLGKTMATRREMEDFKDQYNTAHELLRAQINELRSRLDVGPAGLGVLQQRVDTGQGVSKGMTTAVGFALTGMIVLVAIISVVTAILVK